MANPSILIEIEAADQTKAATASATRQVEKVGAAAKKSAFDAKKAWQAYGVAMRNAAVIVGGTILLIKQAFDAANASAERLGRTDVTAQFESMNAAIQVSFDNLMQTTGAIDLLANAMYGLEYAARLVGLAVTVAMAEIQKGAIQAQFELDKLARNTQGPVGLPGGTTREQAKAMIAAREARLGLTQADVDARKAEIDAQTAMKASAYSNEALAAAIKLRADQQSKAKDATDKATKSLTMENAAESDYAKQKKQRQAQTYSELLRIAQSYQDRLKEIQNQGSEDIEDAIRNGDARALADAKKGKANALAELEKNKADALKQLAFSFMDMSTQAGAKQAASFMGMGSEFDAMLKEYQAKYGTTPVEGGVAGNYAGMPGAKSTVSKNRSAGAGPRPAPTPEGSKPQSVNVSVYIGNEQIDARVQTVIAQTVFNTAKPKDKRR